MDDDPFEQGRRGEAPTYGAPIEDQFAYQDGVAARDAEQRQQAESEQRSRDEQNRIWDERRQAQEADSSASTGYGRAPSPDWSAPTVPEPEDESDDLLGGIALFVAAAAVIGWAVSSFVLHRPDTLRDAAIVAGATYVILLAVFSLAAGLIATIATLVVVAICGLLGAGVGYGIGIVGHRPDPFEFVIPAALIGAAIGGYLGVAATDTPDEEPRLRRPTLRR